MLSQLSRAISVPVQCKEIPPPSAGESLPVLDCHQNGYVYRRVLLTVIAGICLSMVACQPRSSVTEAPNPASESSVAESTSVFLNGSGATFPLFLYQRWFSEYNALHPNVEINYQPTGSAAGIQQVISETVDFGASDIAMTDAEIAQVDRGVILLPMTAGSVAIAYNLPGFESGLKLSRSVYTDILLGRITQWNDPQIVALNGDRTLPDLPIIVVHRSDGSGTTAVLTAHLSAISEEWDQQVGSSLSVQWPTGIGIKSNAGVSAQIQQAEGTIGYVEYSYAQQLNLTVAALENQAGEYVQPGVEATIEALSGVEFPDHLRAFVTDPAGAGAYPIVTYSWILAYENYDDPTKSQTLQDVFAWALTEGQQFSEALGYAPLPEGVAEKALAELDKI